MNMESRNQFSGMRTYSLLDLFARIPVNQNELSPFPALFNERRTPCKGDSSNYLECLIFGVIESDGFVLVCVCLLKALSSSALPPAMQGDSHM